MIRRFVAIFLFLIFLFNIGGYYIVFWMLEQQANLQLAERLDLDDYDLKEIVEVKIPISLPYPVYQAGFERKSGNFDFNGEHFSLVKQKYENDTLTIICIRNQVKKQLVLAKEEFSKRSGESGRNCGISFSGKIFQDFDCLSLTIQSLSDGWFKDLDFGDFICNPSLPFCRYCYTPPWS